MVKNARPIAGACFFACAAMLSAASPPCPFRPAATQSEIRTKSGVAVVAVEPNASPSCYNTLIVRWTDDAGQRELLRLGAESIARAYTFRSDGMDFIFARFSELSLAGWTYSALYRLTGDGNLNAVDLTPNSHCERYTLPALDEPTAYGGYFFDKGALYFDAPFAPNSPEMVFVRARLRIAKKAAGCRLVVASCRIN